MYKPATFSLDRQLVKDFQKENITHFKAME
jgi:hypothetical protein